MQLLQIFNLCSNPFLPIRLRPFVFAMHETSSQYNVLLDSYVYTHTSFNSTHHPTPHTQPHPTSPHMLHARFMVPRATAVWPSISMGWITISGIIAVPVGAGIVRLPNYLLQDVIYTIAHCDKRQIEFLSIDHLK